MMDWRIWLHAVWGVSHWLLLIGIGAGWPAAEAQETHNSVNRPLDRFEFTETHMGSPVLIVLYTKDAESANQASKLAYQRMAQLDHAFSDYNNDSELMKLVERFAAEPAEPVAVSQDLFDILKRARTISESTSGAFDVTAAPVIRQWRRARRDRRMPTEKNLQEALARVDYRRIQLSENPNRVQLVTSTRIDLGGIAKGFAAVSVLRTLSARGIDSALVSVAGDIAVGKAPPGRIGWKVQVAGLNPSTDKPLAMLELENATISTSGDAERFVEIDGRRFSHIVNPRTGLGVERRATVTVIGALDQSADAYATSLYLLGVEGPNLLGRLKPEPSLAVLWMEEKTDGTRILKTNRAFDQLPKIAISDKSHEP